MLLFNKIMFIPGPRLIPNSWERGEEEEEEDVYTRP